MIFRQLTHSPVPMSLLAGHPDVRFSFLRAGIGPRTAEMPRTAAPADGERAGVWTALTSERFCVGAPWLPDPTAVFGVLGPFGMTGYAEL
jgi:hypothetical protein